MLPTNGEAQNKAADFIEGSALTAMMYTGIGEFRGSTRRLLKKEHFNKKQEIISYCNNKRIDSI